MSFFQSLSAPFKSIRLPSMKPVGAFLGAHGARLRAWGWRAGAVGSLALIVLLIHRSIYAYITAQPAYTVKQNPGLVDVSPAWADPRSGDGVVQFRISGEDWNLFDETLVARVGKSFEENAWIRRVTAVERVFPDQVRVKFEVRKPYLAVVRANGIYLLDRDGVRLPGVYGDAPEVECPVRVTGLSGTPPRPGQAWSDPEVAAAFEMAALAAAEPVLARAGVTAVDFSNFGGRLDRRRSDLSLVTAGGCVIEWGRAPSAGQHGEVPLADKLDNLRLVLETYPNLADRQSVKLHVAARGQLPPTVRREAAVGSQKPRK